MKKVCTRCKEEKSLSEFYQRKDRPSHRPECKKCHGQITLRNYKRRQQHFDEKKISRTYGISIAQYRALIQKSDNRCFICGVESVTDRLCVDHDHRTKQVRGLLCQKCNRGLGMFDDDEERLFSAIQYLKGSHMT